MKRDTRLAFIFLVLVVGVTSTASAQTLLQPVTWSGTDSYNAWTGYNGDFYTMGTNGGYIFTEESVQAGGSAMIGFWEEAEEIEVAEDAYYYSVNNYPSHDHSAYQQEIDALCEGFVANNQYSHNGDWSGDKFNDDISWAVIAFIRAYQITGNHQWLIYAKQNFTYVWNNAQPNGVHDGSHGLLQSLPHTLPDGKKWTPNLDAPVNFAFVIAGYLLHDNTTGTDSATYKSEADAIYNWAKANLYVYDFEPCNNQPDFVCSKIYDSNNTSLGGDIGASDFTYNYGIAIQAATREGDNTVASTVANWLMYNSNNQNYPYVGIFNGYEVLPNYSDTGKDNSCNDCGYNGIALRGIAFGLSRGSLSNPNTLAWAQANVQAAWNIRNSDNVMWDDWNAPTSGDQYSWGDSGALAGMLDVPAPGGYPQ
jgi:hypothetical protein